MAKKNQQQSLSLFETNEPVNEQQDSLLQKEASQVSKSVDPLACPKCGNASQPAAHPQDHGGCTRYCIFCQVDGEPFYFIPKSEVPF